jgi:hypothetical protein
VSDALTFLLFVGIWIFVQAYLLPKAGVST